MNIQYVHSTFLPLYSLVGVWKATPPLLALGLVLGLVLVLELGLGLGLFNQPMTMTMTLKPMVMKMRKKRKKRVARKPKAKNDCPPRVTLPNQTLEMQNAVVIVRLQREM